MIFIGTDIVKISRINEIISDKGQLFLSRIFTKDEQSVCNARVSPYIHYGGKFAAKEAVKKAIMSFDKKKIIPFHSIEIKNIDNGAPMVILKDDMENFANLQVSISHTDEYATATAILEIK